MTPASGTNGTACVRVDHDPRAVAAGGRRDRLEVGHLAGLHLDEAERHERRGRPDGPASSSNGTSRTVAPRSLATRIGNRLEVNSSAGTTTSSPGPSIPATSPVPTEEAGIVAIVSSAAPMSRAKSRGAWSVGASQSVTQSPVPACQSAGRLVQRVDGRLRRQPVRRAVEVGDPGRRVELGADRRPRSRGGRRAQAHAIFPPLKLMQWVLRWVNVWSASTPRSSPSPDILWPSYGTLTGR